MKQQPSTTSVNHTMSGSESQDNGKKPLSAGPSFTSFDSSAVPDRNRLPFTNSLESPLYPRPFDHFIEADALNILDVDKHPLELPQVAELKPSISSGIGNSHSTNARHADLSRNDTLKFVTSHGISNDKHPTALEDTRKFPGILDLSESSTIVRDSRLQQPPTSNISYGRDDLSTSQSAECFLSRQNLPSKRNEAVYHLYPAPGRSRLTSQDFRKTSGSNTAPYLALHDNAEISPSIGNTLISSNHHRATGYASADVAPKAKQRPRSVDATHRFNFLDLFKESADAVSTTFDEVSSKFSRFSPFYSKDDQLPSSRSSEEIDRRMSFNSAYSFFDQLKTFRTSNKEESNSTQRDLSSASRQGSSRRGRLSPRETPSLIPKEFAEQLRKGVTFTANVAGGALRISELKGVPKAPRVSKSALDLSTAALKVLEDERSTRQSAYHSPQSQGVVDRTERGGGYGTMPWRDSAHVVKGKKRSSTHSYVDLADVLRRRQQQIDSIPCDEAIEEQQLIQSKNVKGSSLLSPFEKSQQLAPEQMLMEKLDLAQENESLPEGDFSVCVPAEPLFRVKTPPTSIPIQSKNATTTTTLDKLSFMTFNAGLLEYRLGGMTWYSNPPFTKRRLYHMAPALKKANCDIIALQEVYEEWQADFLTETLRVTYPFTARRTSGGSFSLHNGLMIVSRFPILHTTFHPFNVEREWKLLRLPQVTPLEKMFGTKGMLEAIIEIPTVGRVMLLNIHLASGAVDPESEALEALRNEEIKQALSICSLAVRRGEVPVIIGDLNASPSLCPSNYKMFLENGWRDGFLLAVKGDSAQDPVGELKRLSSWHEFDRSEKRKTLMFKISANLTKAKKVLGISEETLKRLFFGAEVQRRRSFDLNEGVLSTSNSLRYKSREIKCYQPSIFASHLRFRRRKRNLYYKGSERAREIAMTVSGSHRQHVNEPPKVYMLSESKDKILSQRKIMRDNAPPLDDTSPNDSAKVHRKNIVTIGSFSTSEADFEINEEKEGLLPQSKAPQRLLSFQNRGQKGYQHLPDSLRHTFYYSDRDELAALYKKNRKRKKVSRRIESKEHQNAICPKFNAKGDVVIELDLEADPFCTQIYTWDPENPLNAIGPHSECHGLRCDHIFLPPTSVAGGLAAFEPTDVSVIFTDPQVTVEGCCCGLMGQGSLVTLSDHYGVRLELRRMILLTKAFQSPKGN